jgi:hypothetical protein
MKPRGVGTDTRRGAFVFAFYFRLEQVQSDDDLFGLRGRDRNSLDCLAQVLDDPAGHNEMCRWLVIVDDAVRAPAALARAPRRAGGA